MRQYLETARFNEIHYQTPDIIFYFVQGVTEPLANLLRKNGLMVKVNMNEIIYYLNKTIL
jgi:hypothetical protein